MFKEVTQLTEQHLKDNWPHTPISFDGVEYNPVRGTAFIRPQLEWTDTENVSIGGRDLGTGYLNINIFTPINNGSHPALDFADQLAELFERWTSGYLTFLVARTIRIGQQEEWYRVDILIPFNFERCIV